MEHINKQKFLAELGRLLTFMYEEDRDRALDLYREIFDSCPDEGALLSQLGSPTRQAVNLARAYDAKERKLQVQAQARGEGDQGELAPAFLQVIEHVRDKAMKLSVPEGQLTFFDSLPEDGEAEETGEEAESPEEEPVVEPAPDAEPGADAQELSDAVTSFLKDFRIQDDALIPSAEIPVADNTPDAGTEPESPDAGTDTPAEEEEPAEAEKPAPAAPIFTMDPAPAPTAPSWQAPQPPAVKAQPVFPDNWADTPVKTVRKPRVALLILFLLFAIPIALVCAALLLIPAAASLGVAAAAIALGFAGFIAAFGSFAVFADILLVFGFSLIVLAIGLLFLWIAIWLLFGAIPGLIRGLAALARKWCYKEVTAA